MAHMWRAAWLMLRILTVAPMVSSPTRTPMPCITMMHTCPLLLHTIKHAHRKSSLQLGMGLREYTTLLLLWSRMCAPRAPAASPAIPYGTTRCEIASKSVR